VQAKKQVLDTPSNVLMFPVSFEALTADLKSKLVLDNSSQTSFLLIIEDLYMYIQTNPQNSQEIEQYIQSYHRGLLVPFSRSEDIDQTYSLFSMQ